MKLKIALAACLAAFALPSAPAAAAEGIPGTCYDIVLPFGDVSEGYECECLLGVQGVEVSPPPPTVTITVCHANIDPLGGGH